MTSFLGILYYFVSSVICFILLAGAIIFLIPLLLGFYIFFTTKNIVRAQNHTLASYEPLTF